MDDLQFDKTLESPAERQARFEREAELIAEARASAAAGHVVPFEALEAWVKSWGTENELPMPVPDLTTPRRWKSLAS